MKTNQWIFMVEIGFNQSITREEAVQYLQSLIVKDYRQRMSKAVPGYLNTTGFTVHTEHRGKTSD